jgi:hypothetical protein
MTLSVNGKSVAEARIEKTQPNIFSADETADVGIDNQTPVAGGDRHRPGDSIHGHDQQDHPREAVGRLGARPAEMDAWTTTARNPRTPISVHNLDTTGACHDHRSKTGVYRLPVSVQGGGIDGRG